ncbi:T-complex protein 1 subunit beta [Tanacetum coccineum]
MLSTCPKPSYSTKNLHVSGSLLKSRSFVSSHKARNIWDSHKVKDPKEWIKYYSQRVEDTVTNDGATILKSLHIDNPAAKVLIDILKVQDDDVGKRMLLSRLRRGTNEKIKL